MEKSAYGIYPERARARRQMKLIRKRNYQWAKTRIVRYPRYNGIHTASLLAHRTPIAGELKYFEKLHEGPVSSLAWNPAGTFIATGSTDKTSVIWDVETANPRQRQRFEFHDGPVLSVDWLDDITFATSSVDAQIYVCQLGHIEPLQQYSHDGEVNKVAWDPTRKYLASCSNDNTLKVWTMESDKPIWTGKGHQKDVTTLAWHPDGDAMLLITVSIDHTARLWDVSKRECLHVFRGHDADVTWAEFSPDGRHIATASRDGALKLWWSNKNKEHGLIKSYQDEKAHSVIQARWNNAGEKVALICGTTSVSVLDLSEVLPSKV
ncbi:hypothetical protein HDU85_004855 [Gaertneriomyces sp. JEL0708]|nr:hypothetical protein HDU85_004855 [Gaertneriomyces sp. JEL0708]